MVIFYQPIVFGLAHFLAQQVGKSQNLIIQFKIHGSIFTDLILEDVVIKPGPKNNVFPFENLAVKRIATQYNLGRLFQNRMMDLVDVVLVDNAHLVIRPVPPSRTQGTQGAPQQPKPVRFPLILPYKIDIRNFNLILREPTGNLELDNAGLQFRRGETGSLTCGRLVIPNLGDWQNLRALISESNSTIRLAELQLPPYLNINELTADLSQSMKGAGAFSLDATFLKAKLQAQGAITQEPVGNRAPFSFKAEAAGLDLTELEKFFPQRLEGEIPIFSVNLSGDAYQPSRWSGNVQLKADQIHWDRYVVDTVQFKSEVFQGEGRSLDLAARAGQNLLQLSGKFVLPPDWSGFVSEVRADLGFACWLGDPSVVAPGVSTSLLVTGSAGTEQGHFSANVTVNGKPIEVASSKINAPGALACVAGSLPIAANWADSVAAALVARTGAVQYQTLRIPEVRMNARLDHPGASSGSQPSVSMAADVLAQPSSIRISIEAPIPKPGTTPDPHTIQARLGMDIRSVNDFLVGSKVAGTLSAKGDVSVKNLQPDGQITVIGNSLNYRNLVAQSANLEFRFLPDQIEISKGNILLDPANSIQLGGTIRLEDPYTYQFSAKVDFAQLGVLNAFASNFIPDAGIAGQLGIEAEANGAVKNAFPSGQVAMTGSKIGLHGLSIQQLNLAASTANGDVDLSQLRILFNQNNQIDMTGAGKLTEKLPYSGHASVRLNDLAYFNQVLRGFHQDLGLSGKLALDWGGSGESGNSGGQLELKATEVAVKQVQHINANISGNYQALEANLPTVQVTSPLASVGMSLHVNPKNLDIEGLTVKTRDQQLTGHATIPLDFQSGSKIPVAIGQPINVDLQTKKVSLASFQGSKPAVEGNGTLSMQASGDTSNPNVIVNLAVADIRSSAARAFAAASMNTTVKLENKILTVDGSVKQADIQPLTINGKMPFDFAQFVKTGALAQTTPIQASIKWPDTNLSFLRRVIPEIRVIEGHAGISIDAGGTLAKPTVQGEVHANIPLARAKVDVVPPVSDFVAQINFRENRIELAQLKGNAAGGPFNVGGTIDLTKGTDPNFDITIHGDQILLTRSDNIIVRSNLDLSIKGPLSAGSIDGRVLITNSRFFQDIDILPLNLPGQPAPQPPGQPPNASIQTPPFNNWKFNIAVQTADPFRIQSNLARGSVVINLQVGGTGQKPEVTGNVKISQLTASLPFSHMDISNSYVNFNPGGNPLDPQLNIRGTSMVRDYDITMQIYGPVSNFKILFQSSPPLSQGDIATLLATGSTSSEFVQDPSLLAGRAAFLLIRQLYGKIFKSGRASQPQQELLDRLEVDIIPGQRVGSQDVSARFSVTRSWQVVAEFGSIGNVSGQLRYLIRFR